MATVLSSNIVPTQASLEKSKSADRSSSHNIQGDRQSSTCSLMHVEKTYEPFIPGYDVEYDSFPVNIQCQYCDKYVTTDVKFIVQWQQYMFSAALFFCLCFVCVPFPCLLDDLKNVQHRCPACKAVVGSKTALGF